MEFRGVDVVRQLRSDLDRLLLGVIALVRAGLRRAVVVPRPPLSGAGARTVVSARTVLLEPLALALGTVSTTPVVTLAVGRPTATIVPLIITTRPIVTLSVGRPTATIIALIITTRPIVTLSVGRPTATIIALIITTRPIVTSLVRPRALLAAATVVLAVGPRSVRARTTVALAVVTARTLESVPALALTALVATTPVVPAPVVGTSVVALESLLGTVSAVVEAPLVGAASLAAPPVVPVLVVAPAALRVRTLGTVVTIGAAPAIVLAVELTRSAPSVVAPFVPRSAALLERTSALAVVELGIPAVSALVAGSPPAVLAVLRVILATGVAPGLLIASLTEGPLAVAAVGSPIFDARTAPLVAVPVRAIAAALGAVVAETSRATVAAAVGSATTEPSSGRPLSAGLAATAAGVGSAAVAAATCVVGPGHQTSWKAILG
ncbi:hypothetical protein ACL03H_23570 [Saccharopolyspora sp. MS10]|uniref:hypothetical protein n=1 Tax=Saccharopolyspora sp. MS10 TaxID=3385973 RepID=UPI0039A065DB